MKKKKVLIFHNALTPYRIDFFNSISKRFNTTVYFNFRNDPVQSFDQKELLSKCSFNIHYLITGFEFFGRSFRFGISRILKREGPDIVICSEYGAITTITYLYKKLNNKHYKVFTMSDDGIDTSLKRKGGRKLLRDFISKNIDGVILPGQEVCHWYQQNISCKINTLVAPIIHDDIVFRNKLKDCLKVSKNYGITKNVNGKKIILYVGRLVMVKNLFFLLKAFSKLKDENCYLVLIGDGYLKSEIQELAVDLNLNNKVLFEGRKEGEELLAWYNVGQIFVLPSYNERFGAVVNEALLGGCYVFCSKKAGASSLINSSNGQVFDPENEDALLFQLNKKIGQIEPFNAKTVELRENKMPFRFSDIMDTFLLQLEK